MTTCVHIQKKRWLDRYCVSIRAILNQIVSTETSTNASVRLIVCIVTVNTFIKVQTVVYTPLHFDYILQIQSSVWCPWRLCLCYKLPSNPVIPYSKFLFFV